MNSLFKQVNKILLDNYNVKELISSNMKGETSFLREKLNSVLRNYKLKKIGVVEFESSASAIFDAISKITEVVIIYNVLNVKLQLNENEKKLMQSIKDKVMGNYEVDFGLDQQSK